MTDPVAPPLRPHISATLPLRFAQAGTFAGIVLGGWCLWLGIQAASEPTAVLAHQESDDAAIEQAAENHSSPAKPRRLSARITDVSDSRNAPTDVVHAVVADDLQTGGAVTVANYSSRQNASATETTKTSDAVRESGAWLTGVIEVMDVSPDEPVTPSPIPAWKRTTKPLRQSSDQNRHFGSE